MFRIKLHLSSIQGTGVKKIQEGNSTANDNVTTNIE